MLRIKARMLEPPTLVFGRGEKIMPRDGGWSMMRASSRDWPLELTSAGKTLYSAPALECYAVVVFSQPGRAPMGMEQVLSQFLQALVSSGQEVGLNIAMTNPEIIFSSAYGREAVREAFVQAGMKTHQKFNRLPQVRPRLTALADSPDDHLHPAQQVGRALRHRTSRSADRANRSQVKALGDTDFVLTRVRYPR